MIRLIRKNNDQILIFFVKLIQLILLDKKSEAENTPKGALTSVTAPAHPYATDAVVYTALFNDSLTIVWDKTSSERCAG